MSDVVHGLQIEWLCTHEMVMIVIH